MKTTRLILILLIFYALAFSTNAQIKVTNSTQQTFYICFAVESMNNHTEEEFINTIGWWKVEPGETKFPAIEFGIGFIKNFYYSVMSSTSDKSFTGDYSFLVQDDAFDIITGSPIDPSQLEAFPKAYYRSFKKKEIEYIAESGKYTATFNFTNTTKSSENQSSQSISGTYAYETENSFGIVVIKDLGNKQFTFEISVGNDRECYGDFSETATIGTDGVGKYSGEGCNSLTFVFNGNKLSVTEDYCDYHGSSCDFAGDYTKK